MFDLSSPNLVRVVRYGFGDMSQEGRKVERDKALEMAMSQIERQFGKGAVMKMGEAAQRRVDVISTGALSLDLALGIGGVPRGRIIEVYGPESSGKTTVGLHIIAEAQRNGGLEEPAASQQDGLASGAGERKRHQAGQASESSQATGPSPRGCEALRQGGAWRVGEASGVADHGDESRSISGSLAEPRIAVAAIRPR